MHVRFRPIADISNFDDNEAMPALKEVQSQLASYLSGMHEAGRHVVCPRCDGQGEVVPAQIVATGERILICDECDRVWHGGEEPRSDNAGSFEELMQVRKLPAYWTELTIGW